jgi:hypothetical protein
MKKMFNLILAVTVFAGLTAVTSCSKTCDEGFEGTKCDTEIREKFTGTSSTTYTATEDGTLSQPATFDVTISKSTTGATKILIGNVWNTFTNQVLATVDGDKFTIENQTPDNDGYSVQGTGTINGNKITVNYSVTDNNATPATTDQINNGVWTKK